LKKVIRILQFIENHGLSVTDFERTAGFSNGYLLNTKKREADITPKALIKLKNNLPEYFNQIFPEEGDNSSIENKMDDPAVNYSKKDPATEMAALLVKAMEILSQNQRIIEKHAETIDKHAETMQEHALIIHDQQATIHQLVVNKKTKASA
jgi:hypothetical protein